MAVRGGASLEVEAEKEPAGPIEAVVKYRLEFPERLRIVNDMHHQAEFDMRMAYLKASPELFVGFQAAFAREAERFIAACDVLDPQR